MARDLVFRPVPCGEVVRLKPVTEHTSPYGPGIQVTIQLLPGSPQPELGTVMIGTNFHYVPPTEGENDGG